MAQIHFRDIPQAVHQIVLSYLPCREQLRVRGACREWQDSIEDGVFLRHFMHLKPLYYRMRFGNPGAISPPYVNRNLPYALERLFRLAADAGNIWAQGCALLCVLSAPTAQPSSLSTLPSPSESETDEPAVTPLLVSAWESNRYPICSAVRIIQFIKSIQSPSLFSQALSQLVDALLSHDVDAWRILIVLHEIHLLHADQSDAIAFKQIILKLRPSLPSVVSFLASVCQEPMDQHPLYRFQTTYLSSISDIESLPSTIPSKLVDKDLLRFLLPKLRPDDDDVDTADISLEIDEKFQQLFELECDVMVIHHDHIQQRLAFLEDGTLRRQATKLIYEAAEKRHDAMSLKLIAGMHLQVVDPLAMQQQHVRNPYGEICQAYIFTEVACLVLERQHPEILKKNPSLLSLLTTLRRRITKEDKIAAELAARSWLRAHPIHATSLQLQGL